MRNEELGVSTDRLLPSLRCVQCGEWIDELILRNRVISQNPGTPDDGQQSIGYDSSRDQQSKRMRKSIHGK
jgi:hypothetical protein